MDTYNLVELAQKGDKRAANQLMKECKPWVVGVISKKFKPVTDEKIQICLVNIFENIEKYDDQGYHFSSWAKIVARNKMYDYHRKKARIDHPLSSLDKKIEGTDIPLKSSLAYSDGSPYPSVDWAETPETIFEEKDMMSHLDELLSYVESNHRNHYPETVRLKLQGYRDEQISMMMDMPRGTVKSNLHRFQSKLAEIVRNKPKYEEMKSLIGK